MSTFSKGVWGRRHAVVIICTTILLPVISVVGILSGARTDLLGSRVLVVALFLVLAASPRFDERNRSVLAVAGALTAGSALVGASGGYFLAHLIFPFIASVITLYRKLSTVFLSILYFILYYGFFGFTAPETIYDDASLSMDYSLFSFTVVCVSLAAAGIGIASWLLDTSAAKENLALSTALADAALRQSQATELHDNVIQSLATAKYALEVADLDTSKKSLEQALETTKALVGSLLTVEGANLTHLMSITGVSSRIVDGAGTDLDINRSHAGTGFSISENDGNGKGK
ncbi:MAG: hypothetical protein ACKOW9_04885 [Candidatus Paceibacterota bacterium]